MDRAAQLGTTDREVDQLRARVAQLEKECRSLRAACAEASRASGDHPAVGSQGQALPRHDENRLKLLADALPVAIAYLDPEWRYRFVNPAYGSWIGKAVEKICGATVAETVGAAAFHEIEKRLDSLTSGEPVRFERSMVRPDGELRQVRISYLADLDHSKALRGIIQIVTDLTELRDTEAQLRDSQVLFESAARMARLGHFIWDEVEQRSVFCSEEMSRINGMTVEAYLSRFSSYDALLGLVHPEDRERFDSVLTRAYDEKAAYNLDFRVVLPDGTERHFREHGEPVLDRIGTLVRTIGIQQDITELKAIENTLRESERRFRDFAAVSAHWLWETGPDLRFRYISDSMTKVTGEAPDQLIGKTRLEVAGPNPPDAEALLENLAQMERREAFDEFVYTRPTLDGRPVHLAISGKPVFSDSGEFLGYRGTARDVTALKTAQKSLEKTDALYRETERLARLGHWEWDEVQDRCIYCTEELARLHGVTVQDYVELASSTGGDLAFVHPDDRQRYSETIEAARSRCADLRIDYRLQSRTGEVLEVREVAKFVADQSGRAIRSFGFVQDLSELRSVEADLRQSEAALAQAQEIAKIGHWHWSIETDELVSCSEEYARIHGVTMDQVTDHLRRQMEIVIHPADRDRVAAAFERFDEEGLDFQIEYRIFRPDGEVRHVQEIGEALFDAKGTAIAHVGTLQDITDRKQAEGALRISEARFRDFAESASDWFWETDALHRVTWVSALMEQVLGLDPSTVIGKTRWEIQGIDPDQDPLWKAHKKTLEAHLPFQGLEYIHRMNGKEFHLSVSGRPFFDEQGQFLGYRGTASEITERKLAEMALQRAKDELDERVRQRTAELRKTNETLVKEIKIRKLAEAAAEQSRELLAQAVEALDEGFVIYDADERMVLCNSKYREIYHAVGSELFEPGTRLEDVARAAARHCIGLTEKSEQDAWVKQRLAQHRGNNWQRIHQHIDGRRVQVSENRLPNGWTVGTRTDVTEMKSHELDLAEQARSIGLLQRIGSAANQAPDVEAAIQGCLDEVCNYTGWALGQAYRLESDGSERLVHAKLSSETGPLRFDDLQRYLADLSLEHGEGLPGRVLEHRKPQCTQDLAADPRFRTGPDGIPFGLRSGCAFPVPVGGTVAIVLEFLSEKSSEPDEQIMGTMRSVGEQLGRMIERKLSDDAIKQSEQQLRRVIDLVPLMIFAKSSDGRFTLANQAVADTLGAAVEDVIGKTTQDFLCPDEDSSGFRARDQAVISGEIQELVAEEELTDHTGRLRILRMIKVPFNQSGHDSPVVLGVAMDITEQREKERQLQQAQKMDAVGKLTGGVAHDFNNLLFVIQGNLQLLEEELPETDEVAQLIDAIKRAAGLGADLTRSLLAFSRQQPLKPELLDLAPVISGSISLLNRTLSEDILIETRFEDPIWSVLIDRYQLENAIINLAVNARDAMVDGGTLQITMENSRVRVTAGLTPDEIHAGPAPGDYVRIEVSDTGCGMPQEAIEQAFEPFFTTKKAGAGTGLGLSMVYGFVTQSGGHIEIRSAVGEGTSVIILLPRSAGSEASGEVSAPETERPEGPRATILVTEDDRAVRRVAVKILKKLGYETLEAKDGQEALALLESAPQVTLLFTDVIMPGGMNGRQLAEEAQRRRPDLKVLFSSGYSQSAIIRDGKLEDGVELIAKPYQSEELAQRVSQVLKRGGQAV